MNGVAPALTLKHEGSLGKALPRSRMRANNWLQATRRSVALQRFPPWPSASPARINLGVGPSAKEGLMPREEKGSRDPL
jgi:hypothetical protein